MRVSGRNTKTLRPTPPRGQGSGNARVRPGRGQRRTLRGGINLDRRDGRFLGEGGAEGRELARHLLGRRGGGKIGAVVSRFVRASVSR